MPSRYTRRMPDPLPDPSRYSAALARAQALPLPEKVYTWWSYRAKDWTAADRGRRLDHVWSSADLSTHLASVEILRAARGWERPSDHVPIVVSLDI